MKKPAATKEQKKTEIEQLSQAELVEMQGERILFNTVHQW